MGKLTFQANLGGSVNLIGPNTASTVNLTLPSAAGSNAQPLVTDGSGNLSFATLTPAGGGTGQTTYTDGQLLIGNTTGNTLAKSTLTAGSGVSITNGSGSITISATGSGGTVTSVAATVPSFLSITGSPITTTGTLAIGLSGTALPVANGGTGLTSGTSGGVPYYSATGTLASSAALAASSIVLGGGAGVAPATTTTGTGVVTALGVNTGSTGAFVVNGGVLGTPSSGTATNLTGLPLSTGVTGTLPVGNGGTGQTTYTDGQLLIGNSTGNTLAKSTLTAGSGISVTNGSGSVTIAASAATSTALGTLYGSMTASGGTPFLTAVGYNAGNVATGVNNTFFGKDTGKLVSTGTDNTIAGWSAGDALTTGNQNTAFGSNALGAASTTSNLTAFGYQALAAATSTQNVAVGWNSGAQVSSGGSNTFVGWQTGFQITTGTDNTLVGSNTGSGNNKTAATAIGSSALQVATGTNNTAVGYNAGVAVSTGTYNTLVGSTSGNAITTGGKNSVFGAYTGNSGGLDIRTTSNNIVLSDGDGNPRWYIDSTGAAGYSPSTGGAITQVTSRTTGVTLNKPTGAITLVSAAGTTAWQSFTVTNSTVTALDVIHVSQKSGTDLYQIFVTAVAAGSFKITFATTGGTTTEQPVFNFALIKGQTA